MLFKITGRVTNTDILKAMGENKLFLPFQFNKILKGLDLLKVGKW